jgi:4-hydroxybenzoate polyprenyltransferase
MVGRVDIATETATSGRLTAVARRRYETLPPVVRALRPLQWSKSSLVFAALLFDRRIFDGESLLRCLGAALIFCAVSSAMYLINDLRDIHQDRLHPRKQLRPIAAGEVSPHGARRLAILLLVAALAATIGVRPAFIGIVVGYIALMVAYSYGLKRLVILDVFAIAAGFVLRAAGGAVAIGVPASPWLYVCTALGALMIGFGKRRNELVTLQHVAGQHRANLDQYSVPMLDQILSIVSAATLIAYSLYTFDAPNVPESHAMMLTIPFVAYGLFRYLYLVYRRNEGGSPELLLIKDPGLLAAVAGWVVTSLTVLYLG